MSDLRRRFYLLFIIFLSNHSLSVLLRENIILAYPVDNVRYPEEVHHILIFARTGV